MQAFVPKNRKPKFELNLKIIDLNNVPLVSGTSYVKWHLPSSSSAEHRGRTAKSAIKEHKVIWGYQQVLLVRLTIDKNGMLQESEIHFEVIQEYASGVRIERITLGSVKLNLAEYVEGGDGDGEEGITRRYLMQESKINSTLKSFICYLDHVSYKRHPSPPLKTAPVFGGIAGILSNEQAEQQEELGQMPSLNKTREIGELQDMYRRSLAASWATQAGELPADECIENIFAGGTGWREGTNHEDTDGGGEEAGVSGGDGEYRASHGGHRHKNSTGDGGRSVSKSRAPQTPRLHLRNLSENSLGPGLEDGGERYSEMLGEKGGKRIYTKLSCEVDEIDVREDLRSWKLAISAHT
ncbi:MAG: hypothetical protein M1829_002698 [Trizodia sp. TS-e1964]|nr:MAG: hypothetical protein M1829_002698 [Trizodia sp. TS-e1964]